MTQSNHPLNQLGETRCVTLVNKLKALMSTSDFKEEPEQSPDNEEQEEASFIKWLMTQGVDESENFKNTGCAAGTGPLAFWVPFFPVFLASKVSFFL